MDREQHKKKLGLDKYWEYKRTELCCPFCMKKGLWVDTHELRGATHYCKRCKMGLTIVPNVPKRLIHLES